MITAASGPFFGAKTFELYAVRIGVLTGTLMDCPIQLLIVHAGFADRCSEGVLRP
jgi:hypothetical protein